MTVIELGDVGAAAPGPEGAESTPEFNPRVWRRTAAAGVVLLCLLVLGASSRPGTPMVREVWSIRPAADFSATIRTDGVFVHLRTTDGTELVAYEVATGAVRWRRAFDGAPAYLGVGQEAGLLLIPGDEKVDEFPLDDGSTGVMVYGGTTTAVDARTGDRLWRQAGEILDAPGGLLLFGERTRDGSFSSIRLVRPRDGTTVWRRAAAGIEQVLLSPDGPAPDRMVTSDARGNVTILRFADGTVLSEGRVPWTRSNPDGGLETYLAAASGVLAVVRTDPQRSRIAAYRLDTLEELWQTEASPYSFIQECGPVLCLSETSAITAVDRLTGRQIWRLPDYSAVTLVGEDRLLASTAGPTREHQMLLEATTGRQIGRGGAGWMMSTPSGADSLVLLHRVFGEDRTYSSVSRLDVRTGRVVRIGAVEGADGPQCTSAGRYMACDQAGRLVITAVG
jgi:outer membrane protein assembly factor BamB